MSHHLVATGCLLAAALITRRAAAQLPPPPPMNDAPPPGAPAPFAMSTVTHPYLASLPGSVPVVFVSDGEPVAISALAGVASVTYANAWVSNNAYASRRSIQPMYDYLCTTPCALSLRPGGTTLHLGTATEWPRDVTVVTTPGVPRRVTLRHASVARPIVGLFTVMFGAFGTVGGALVMALSPLVGRSRPATQSDMLIGGGAALAVAGGLLTLGIWLLASPNGGIIRDEPAAASRSTSRLRWLGASVEPTREGQGFVIGTAFGF